MLSVSFFVARRPFKFQAAPANKLIRRLLILIQRRNVQWPNGWLTSDTRAAYQHYDTRQFRRIKNFPFFSKKKKNVQFSGKSFKTSSFIRTVVKYRSFLNVRFTPYVVLAASTGHVFSLNRKEKKEEPPRSACWPDSPGEPSFDHSQHPQLFIIIIITIIMEIHLFHFSLRAQRKCNQFLRHNGR